MPQPRVVVVGARDRGNYGGIESHVCRLTTAIVQQGWFVDLCIRRNVGPTLSLVNSLELQAPASPIAGMLVYLGLALRAIGRIRPDVVHVHGIAAAPIVPLLRMVSVPVVFTHHGKDYLRESINPLTSWMLRLCEFLGVTFSTSVICLTKRTRDEVSRHRTGGVFLIPSGSERPIMMRSEGAGIEGRYLLMGARLVPEKRHLDVIAAFNDAALPDWRLVIAGTAEPWTEYASSVLRAAEGQPMIEVLGQVQQAKYHELLQFAGAFILASTYEEHPMALVEALGSKATLLLSDIPPHRELAGDDAVYFAPGDVPSISRAMQGLARAVPTARKNQTHLEWDDVAIKTLAVYQHACGKTDYLTAPPFNLE